MIKQINSAKAKLKKQTNNWAKWSEAELSAEGYSVSGPSSCGATGNGIEHYWASPFSASHWNAWRDERAQSRCDVWLQGFRKSDQSGKHGFSCSFACFSSFFISLLLQSWCKQVVSPSVRSGGVGCGRAGLKKQHPLSGQTQIPLCFLVVLSLSLCPWWKPKQRR